MRYRWLGLLVLLSTLHGWAQSDPTNTLARDCRLDGLVADGKTDNAAALNTCIATAYTNGQMTVELPSGQIKVNSVIDATNRPGLHFKGAAYPGGARIDTPLTVILCNTGTSCFSMEGSGGTILENISFRIANAYPHPSTVGIVMGRDNAGGGGARNNFCYSQFNVLRHVMVFTDHSTTVNGGRGYIGVYNAGGAELLTIENSEFAQDVALYFSTTNDLNLSDGLQTLATGCPASLTFLKVINSAATFNGTAGQAAVILSNTAFLDFDGLDIVGNKRSGGSGISVNGQNESLRFRVTCETLAAPGSCFVINHANIDHFDFDLFVGGWNGSSPIINWGANNIAVTNSRVRVNNTNPPVQELFGNGAAGIVWRGGEIDLGTTSTSASYSNLKVLGTVVKADGFTDAQVIFAPGSTYLLMNSSGSHFVGSGP